MSVIEANMYGQTGLIQPKAGVEQASGAAAGAQENPTNRVY